MFIRVKRLSVIEDLLLEAENIQNDGNFNELINLAKASSEENDSQDKININDYLDKLFDRIILMGDGEFEKRLDDPNFITLFTRPEMKDLFDKYFEYLKTRVLKYQEDLKAALAKPEVNEAEINNINRTILRFAARLEVIEKIYEKIASATTKPKFVDDLLNEIDQIKDELIKGYELPIITTAERVKQSYDAFTKAETEEDQKEKAKEVFTIIQTVKGSTIEYPEEVSKGLDDVENYYKKQVEAKLGEETVNDIWGGIHVNKNVASLIRRIFEFQYTVWTNEDDIRREANALRTSVNGFNDVSDEAKAYLYRLIDQIQENLIRRAKSKEFDTKKYKGIHYDFNKKMPLYQRTLLPVTGKQIADDTRLMKFRKASQAFMELFFGETSLSDVQSRSFAATGKWVNTLYSKALNKTAKVVGKAVKGREGEMKADAISRLFILDTSVVDEPKKPLISEDGAAPGVSPQVPSSIGGMGPIVPPTSTTLGSGDNFGPKITKRKKNESGRVLDFAKFVKEQNTK